MAVASRGSHFATIRMGLKLMFSERMASMGAGAVLTIGQEPGAASPVDAQQHDVSETGAAHESAIAGEPRKIAAAVKSPTKRIMTLPV